MSSALGVAVVRSAVEVARGVRMLELEPEDGTQRYALGSHLEVEVWLGEQRALRCYSLVGESAHAGAYRIAVKRVAHSRGGSHYLWSLQAGATLSISQPRSHFELRTGSPEYLLIAGGIGITPLLGMATALTRQAAPVRVLYAGRARDELALLPELSALLGERLRVFVGAEGSRIDLRQELQLLHPQAELYVCGPIGLMEEARRVWRAAQRPAHRLRIETFGSSGHRSAETFEVAVADHGRVMSVERDRSLLEVLAEAGIEVPGHCKRGECGLCAVRVLEVDGELDHRDVFLDDEQKAQGQTLCACVSRASGRLAIDTGHRADL